MRAVIIGLGVQGEKRLAVAGSDVAATVDPVAPKAQYKSIEQVPLESFDAALVCIPDREKLEILRYLLSAGKHVLVEKPLLASDGEELRQLGELARRTGSACYIAYNHRFEPHIARLKQILDSQTLGSLYHAKLFYGNGTAIDVKNSVWRDEGDGVLADLGSHLLDMANYLFGPIDERFEPWFKGRFETCASDYVLFGNRGKPVVVLEATFISWRNTFTIDVIGELGSAHINGLCKWGPSTLTVRKRVFPSGIPEEEVQTIECPDPTWTLEYEHFTHLCLTQGTNIDDAHWVNFAIREIAGSAQEAKVR